MNTFQVVRTPANTPAFRPGCVIGESSKINVSILHRWSPSADDSGNGTTTLNDLVGSNDGSFAGGLAAGDWVTDTDNGGTRAINLNGSSDHIDLATAPSIGSGAFGISVWVKLPNASGKDSVFAFGDNATAEQFLLSIENTAGDLWVRCQGNTASGGNGLKDNNWHHIIITKPAGSGIAGVLAYVDGVSDTLTVQSNSGATLNFGTTNSFIGTNIFSTNNFAGRFDNIRFYNRQLTAQDASDLYSAGNGRSK